MPPKGYRVKADGSLQFASSTQKKKKAETPDPRLLGQHSPGTHAMGTGMSSVLGGGVEYLASPARGGTTTPGGFGGRAYPSTDFSNSYNLQQRTASGGSGGSLNTVEGGGSFVIPPAGAEALAKPRRTTKMSCEGEGGGGDGHRADTAMTHPSSVTGKSHAHDEESLVNPNHHVLRFARGETSQIPPTQVGAALIQQQQRAAANASHGLVGGLPGTTPAVKVNTQNLQGRDSVLALEANLVERLGELESDPDLSRHEYVGRAQRVFDDVAVELIRQVTVHCTDRGRLLAKLWVRYSEIINTVTSMFAAERLRHKEEEEKCAKELRQARVDYAKIVEHSEKALQTQFLQQESLLEEQEGRETQLCDELSSVKEELYRVQVKLRVAGRAGSMSEMGHPCSVGGRDLGRHISMAAGAAAAATSDPKSLMGVLAASGIGKSPFASFNQPPQLRRDDAPPEVAIDGATPRGSLRPEGAADDTIASPPHAGTLSLQLPTFSHSRRDSHTPRSHMSSSRRDKESATEREMDLQRQLREMRMTLVDASNELMSFRNQHDLSYSRSTQTETPEAKKVDMACSPIQQAFEDMMNTASGFGAGTVGGPGTGPGGAARLSRRASRSGSITKGGTSNMNTSSQLGGQPSQHAETRSNSLSTSTGLPGSVNSTNAQQSSTTATATAAGNVSTSSNAAESRQTTPQVPSLLPGVPVAASQFGRLSPTPSNTSHSSDSKVSESKPRVVG